MLELVAELTSLMYYAQCVACSGPKEPEEFFAMFFSQPREGGCIKKSVGMRRNR